MYHLLQINIYSSKKRPAYRLVKFVCLVGVHNISRNFAQGNIFFIYLRLRLPPTQRASRNIVHLVFKNR